MTMKKITTTYKKRLKPSDFDVYLKYICPKCSQEHWIRFIQATTKNFKIVCDCSSVLSVKRILDCKLKYQKINKNTQQSSNILEQTKAILLGYGFDNTEIQHLISKVYSSKHNNATELVTSILESMRLKNE